MTKPRRRFLILAIVFISSSLLLKCSSPTDVDTTVTLTVAPTTGFPGTALRVSGLSGLTPADTLSATIGGQPAPVIINDSGLVFVSIPLFLDDSGVVIIPTEKLDLILLENGATLGEAIGAVTVEALPVPTHTLADVTSSLTTISATLDTIISSFSVGPGIEEQYVRAIIAGLDSLISSSGPSSLASAVSGVTADSSLAYVTAILDANGVIEGLMNMANQLQAISFPPTTSYSSLGDATLHRSASPTVIPTLLTDQDLARRMQFYVIAKMFGETVISQTGQTFAETVGLAAGVIGISGRSVPYVSIVSAVLTLIDVVVNKIVVGALPATIDSMSVTFVSDTIHPGDTTEATVYILASNLPPGLGVQDLVGLTLTALGLMGSSSPVQSFKDVLMNTANFFIGVMQSTVAAYSAQHPELKLDVTVAAMPLMKWEAYINDPHLVHCQSLTPSIITGINSSPNWQADTSNYGEGRVYVMPATGANVLLLSLPPGFTYNGGAFGMDIPASRTKSVWVVPKLALRVDFANTISRQGANVLGLDAGYFDSQGNPQWAPGVHINLSVTDGNASVMSGLTDAQGHFSSIITMDSTADSVTVQVSATGNQGSQYDTVVVAHSLDTLGSGWGIRYLPPAPGDVSCMRAVASTYLTISHRLLHDEKSDSYNDSYNETNCAQSHHSVNFSGSVAGTSTNGPATETGNAIVSGDLSLQIGDPNYFRGFTLTGQCDAQVSFSGFVPYGDYDDHSEVHAGGSLEFKVQLLVDSGYFEMTIDGAQSKTATGNGQAELWISWPGLTGPPDTAFSTTVLLTPHTRYVFSVQAQARTGKWTRSGESSGSYRSSATFNLNCRIRRAPYPG